MTRTLATLLSVALATALAACASDRASGVPDTGGRPGRDAGTDTVPTDGGGGGDATTDVPISGFPHLEFVTEQVVDLSIAQRRDLSVRYVGGDDQPVPDTQIAFSYDELRAGGSQLRSLTARTDESGVATVELIGGTVAAEFEVRAAVRGTEEVAPIDFYVTVQQKDSADYLIRLYYETRAVTLQNVEVYLFNDDVGCADIPRNPDDVFGAIDQVRILPLSDGSFDDMPYEAAREDIPLTHAVAVAFKEDTPVAMGCTDGLPAEIEPGSDTLIEIELRDLFPDIKGEFQVTNEFDLLEFLPGTAQTVVRLIGQFFDSPGATLFDILDELGVFDSSDIPFGLDGLLADAIDGILFAVLPPEAVAVFETGSDIYNALQNITLQGSMIFYENADENGALAECNELVLDEIIVNFDTFDTPAFDLSSYGYQGAYGTFTGWLSIEDEGDINYALNIQQFGLELNYGEIAVFVLETIVFPRVIGPEVDSMEAFVESFVDCEAIAADIGWSGLTGICDSLISAAVSGLRDFLTSQTADVSSFYVLATPPSDSTPPSDIELLEEGMRWAPCALEVGTDSGEFQVDTLGGPGRHRCVWDARFRTSSADPTGAPVPAAFDGYRLSTRANGVCGDGR
ncbi:MAG: Ig-like domain-containing protein [Myxococcales bacterium]|nr:Ig-like domain-containing protein [Myxococcales bacterium]MCB9532678.1 Ig-like domain-containing protein [Myxococcales bacterium]MCB9533036.1 Ig-like domain-containing protein [Myxococcales bacterium]